MPSRACTLLYPGNGNKLSTRTILADSDLHCAPLATSGIVPWHNRTKQRKFRNAAGICAKSSHDINEYKWIEKAVKWFKMIRHFGHRTALIAHWWVWELLIAKHLHDWSVKLRPKRLCCPQVRGNIQGKAKNVAGVRILGIGGSWSFVMLGSWTLDSLTELPLKTYSLSPSAVPADRGLSSVPSPADMKCLAVWIL